MRNIMVTNIWICWISFVLLVIRDAVENLSNSEFVKSITFLKIWSRRILLSLAASFADNKTTVTATAIASSASPTIMAPVFNM